MRFILSPRLEFTNLVALFCKQMKAHERLVANIIMPMKELFIGITS